MSEAMQRQTGQTPAWLLYSGVAIGVVGAALKSTLRVSANSSRLWPLRRTVRTSRWRLHLAREALRWLLPAQSWRLLGLS